MGHAARRAPLPAQMRGDLRVPPRRCRVQRIRGGVRARVRRVWALVPRGRRGARMLELVRCAVTGARRLAIRMRGLSARSRETLALAAPLPSEAVRQTIPARIQKCEKKGVRPGIAAGAVYSSHEGSGPKILAVKLPRERLHVCMAVPAPRVPVPSERRIWRRMGYSECLEGLRPRDRGHPDPIWSVQRC